MRVAFLTQWFGGDASSLRGGIAKSLSEQGARVAIFSGTNPYGSQPKFDRGERIGLFARKSSAGGLPVVRFPFYASHDQSALRRFATYGSFAATSLAGVKWLRQADVVLAYCSPATAATAALAAHRIARTPYVLMIQDVWPDSIFATGFVTSSAPRRAAEAIVGRYMDYAYAHAAGITALSPGMRDLLISRGADPARTHVIYNWTDEETASRVKPPTRGEGEPLHLMFAGNMGPGQALDNVLRAIALLPPEKVRLTLVGDGASLPDLQAQARDLDLANVTFLGRLPREEMPAVISDAHLHLVSLADTDLFRITLPSKFQALLAAGLPVLSVAPGEIGYLVSQGRAGFVSPPGDPSALAEVIRDAIATPPAALAAMGENGRRLYREHMSRDANSTALFKVLTDAATA